MRLELSGHIEGDLDDIADYIAQDNPGRAVTFIQDIRMKFRDIQRDPLIYQLRPERWRGGAHGNHRELCDSLPCHG